jgi:hypothetical protein
VRFARFTLLVLVALSALVLSGIASAAPRARPTLTLTGHPLAVAGDNFRARERVVLLISGLTFDKKVVTTDAHGGFRLRVPAVLGLWKCNGFSITAIGARGERAGVGIGTIGCGVGLPTAKPTHIGS